MLYRVFPSLLVLCLSSATLQQGYAGDPPPIPLMRNESVIEQPVVQHTLTQRYTGEATKFIRENKSSPFFLYYAHTMPHYPISVSDGFKGKSENGLYGDVIEEIDWSVGEMNDLSGQFPEKVKEMLVMAQMAGSWLGDRDKPSPNSRPAGFVEKPVPLLIKK